MQNPTPMPASVFVEAVRLAGDPTRSPREAVAHITKWWNNTAEAKFARSHGFMLYAKLGENWLSGMPEEGWVDALTWNRSLSTKAEASLLDQTLIVVFLAESMDGESSFNARAVDGSGGFSGGRTQSEGSGNEIVTRYSFEALNLFPKRFPDAWKALCANTQDAQDAIV